MGRIRPRPKHARPERPQDAVSEARIEAMRLKLEKRCQASSPTAGVKVVSVPEAAITATAGGGDTLPVPDVRALPPSTRPAPLEWETLSPWAIRSSCRIWSGCKVLKAGKASYELWRRIAGLEHPVCIRRGLESFEQCQVIAAMEMECG